MISRKVFLSMIIGLFLLSSFVSATTLVDPTQIGFNDQSRSDNYDALMDAMYADSAIVTTIDNQLWVPWFKTSSSSQVSDLQNGNNCNSGQTIDATHNCMVTDEFSQVGVLVAMGKDETRMEEFYNTVLAIQSTNGHLPSWRVYRDGNTIQACNPQINGNCDTASDADARIIIALYTASQNPLFTDDAMKAEYKSFATTLAKDMLDLEVDKTCLPTDYGVVCNWLAGGSNVKKGGMASSDYAYTGYYPDAIIAMLSAYANTNDEKYLTAAQDFTLNYMQAAKFDGNTFTVPPGKSFKWTIDSWGKPVASCTNTCDPDVWDGFDASRALGMCQAKYYADEMGVTLPELDSYCALLSEKHMMNPTSVPLQFYPDGSATSSQSGYFAQGLQALHQSGVSASLFEQSLDAALSHYSPTQETFDNEASFGIYTKAFVVRALGMGIGRDLPAFIDAEVSITPPTTETQSIVASLSTICETATNSCVLQSDVVSGTCRTVKWTTNAGDVQIQTCEKEDGYVELYRQVYPTSLGIKACVDTVCVGDNTGFARFKPELVSTPTTPTTDNTQTDTTSEQAPATLSVAELAVTCAIGTTNCNLQSDSSDGACRTVTWTTNAGDVQIQACEKEDGYVEMYQQASPSNADVKVCVDVGCVSDASGFARFKPEGITMPTESSTTDETQTDTTPHNTDTTKKTTTDVTPVTETTTEPPVVDSIDLLTVTCNVGSDNCVLQSDEVIGTCRTLQWSTSFGPVQVLACEKENDSVEVYRQSLPSEANIKACVGVGCVDDLRGFASFSY